MRWVLLEISWFHFFVAPFCFSIAELRKLPRNTSPVTLDRWVTLPPGRKWPSVPSCSGPTRCSEQGCTTDIRISWTNSYLRNKCLFWRFLVWVWLVNFSLVAVWWCFCWAPNSHSPTIGPWTDLPAWLTPNGFLTVVNCSFVKFRETSSWKKYDHSKWVVFEIKDSS